MDIKAVRLHHLHELLREQQGRKAELARRVGKKPAQLSQWFSGHRTISEESAREIERRMRKPTGWMDSPVAAGIVQEPAPPSLRPSTPNPQAALLEALATIGLALSADMPDDVRDDLADALAKLARRRGAPRDQQQVLHLLTPQSWKRPRAA